MCVSIAYEFNNTENIKDIERFRLLRFFHALSSVAEEAVMCIPYLPAVGTGCVLQVCLLWLDVRYTVCQFQQHGIPVLTTEVKPELA